MRTSIRALLALLAALVLTFTLSSLALADAGGLETVDEPPAVTQDGSTATDPNADAANPDATLDPNATGSPLAALATTMLPMVLIIAVFYLFLIRPQRKKDKKVKDMLAALKKGDRVCTIGGIYGTIDSIKDDTVSLIVGPGDARMIMARWGIRSVEEIKIENDVGTDLT